MNLTDVDDGTIKAARAAGTTLRRHTEPFVRAFFEDRDYLRLRPAHVHPRATESVPAMIVLVRRLLDRGVAYQGDDGSLYFAIDRFPGYGRLSRLDRREIKVGARVASDEYAKDDPRDFALWKKAGPDDDAVAAGGEGVRRLGEFHARLAAEAGTGGRGEGRLAALAAEFEAAFRAALDDDLNAPQACAALFQLAHAGNRALDAGAGGAVAAVAALDRAMAVLDVLPTPRTPEPDFARWIEAQVAARERARKSKDFKEADRIRAALLARGVELEDTPTRANGRRGVQA